MGNAGLIGFLEALCSKTPRLRLLKIAFTHLLQTHSGRVRWGQVRGYPGQT
jgi:hypothetical protein